VGFCFFVLDISSRVNAYYHMIMDAGIFVNLTYFNPVKQIKAEGVPSVHEVLFSRGAWEQVRMASPAHAPA
jgi:hypothetical protein